MFRNDRCKHTLHLFEINKFTRKCFAITNWWRWIYFFLDFFYIVHPMNVFIFFEIVQQNENHKMMPRTAQFWRSCRRSLPKGCSSQLAIRCVKGGDKAYSKSQNSEVIRQLDNATKCKFRAVRKFGFIAKLCLESDCSIDS